MHRVRSAIAVVGALGFLTAASALADPSISQFPIPTPNAGPADIISGPNGDLWFTETKIDALGVSSPAGAITQQGSLSAPGYGVAKDAAGDLWITEPNANQIARLTPAGAITTFRLPKSHNDGPVEIAAGPDGNMWFTVAGPGGAAIGKITPTGTVTEYSKGLSPQSDPLAITTGPDGNLWFTEWSAGAIGRITPTGTITQFSLPASSAPAGIAAGPDGNLWFTEWGATAIGKITPAGTITQYTTGLTANSEPNGITAGPDGNLWFTEYGGSGAIGEITPAGTITQYTTGLTANSQPSGITIGPDGNLWFTELGNGGAIGRVLLPPQTTSSSTTTTTTTTGSSPVTQIAPPAIGRTALATVVSGHVEVAGPSGQFQPLSGHTEIKVGDVLNTDHGVVRITTALRVRRHHSLYQTAQVWGGVFRLQQSRQRSMTTFRLMAAVSCASRRAAHLAGHTRAGSRKPVKRILWARDNGGQYTTHGRNSVATVRGTEWETVESCAGTTTYVKRGVVAVTNIHNGHTVLVHAGHRYLARR